MAVYEGAFEFSYISAGAFSPPFVCTIHAEEPGAADLAVALALSVNMEVAWVTGDGQRSLRSITPTSFRLERIRVRSADGGGIAVERIPAAATAAGANSGDPVPLQCATLCRWGTAVGGRGNKGRMYWMAPNESEQSGGLLTTIARDEHQDAFEDLHTLINDGVVGLVHVVFHRATGTTTEIISTEADARIATQRRRAAYAQ